MLSDPAYEHFSSLGRIAMGARSLLFRALVERSRLSGGRRQPVEVTLQHLSHVREGFVITLRTSHFASASELRDVVRMILVDWSWVEGLGIRWAGRDIPIEEPVKQVLSFAHAAVALGSMPRLPADQVTFPHAGRTYADIPVPRTPGETLARIDEMEAVIARSADRPIHRLGRETVRRTYGYFETSAWLVSGHERRFGSAH